MSASEFADRKVSRREKVRILSVEDSVPIRRENESALDHAGYDVICAEDGETAFANGTRG